MSSTPEAPARRPTENEGLSRTVTLRKLVVFRGLSQILMTALAVTCLLGSYLFVVTSQTLAAALFGILVIFSVLRMRYWRRADFSRMSVEEQARQLLRVRVSAFIIAPVMSAAAVYVIMVLPAESVFMVAGWMTMMACIAGFTLCSLPMTARIVMVILLLPPNIAMMLGESIHKYLFSASMILLSLFCMWTFSSVLKLIHNLSNEAEENAKQRGWIAATMRNFLELSRDVAWQVDSRGRFTQLGNTVQELTGWDAGSLIGVEISSLIEFSDDPALASRQRFNEVMNAGNPFHNLVCRIRHSDGGDRYIRIAGTPVQDHAGKTAGYRGLISDITEQMRNQLATVQSEARFRDFAVLAADCLWETDADLRFTFMSEAVERWSGLSAENFIGDKLLAEFTEDEAMEGELGDWSALEAKLARRESFEDFVFTDGRGHVLSLAGKPYFDKCGGFLGYRGYTTEITVEYNAKQATAEAEAKLTEANRQLEERIAQRTRELQVKTDLMQEIFDTMGESLVVLDEEMTVEMINEKPSISLPPGDWDLSIDAEAIYGRAYSLGLYPQMQRDEKGTDPISDLLSAGQFFRLNRIDTSGQHISENFYPRAGGGYVILYTDITREARREEELRTLSVDLRRSKEAAEAASRTKSEFLANMSHEIRTPMNGILGMTEILMGTPLSDDQKDMTRVVMRSADSLLTIINDILDFSKLEAGKMTFVKEEFDLENALRDVTGIIAPKATEKGISLDLSFKDKPGGLLVGDVGRVRQVVTNLVGNAVKFTEDGGVTITVDQTSRNDMATVRIAVSDTGCGIPQDKLERVFNKFEQVDGSSSRRYEGTGLGLSISRRIAEMMGGTITVESEVDQGSVFTFEVTLPLIETSAEEPLTAEAAPQTCLKGMLKGCSVLVAEDNPVNQMVMRAMLEPLGCSLQVAGNGEEAVALYSETDFDLVLMDVSMPVMDGLQATSQIKRLQKSAGRHVPVIGITAHAMREDRERGHKAGMDDYLTKPVQQKAVMEKISFWMQHKIAPSGKTKETDAA